MLAHTMLTNRCSPLSIRLGSSCSYHYSVPTRCSISKPPIACSSNAAKAAIITGTYAVTAGLCLCIWPLTSFALLFPTAVVARGWIRVGGTLFALIGMQYLGTGLADQKSGGEASSESFYRSTVISRVFLAAVFAGIVALGEAPVTLLLLSLLNLIGAASMQWALAKDQRKG